MNYTQLQEEVWRYLGFPDTTSGQRTDWRRQEIREAINRRLQEAAATCAPSLNFLKRETSIAMVSGTSDYLIADDCQRPLSIWIEGTEAQELYFSRALAADQDGSRNGNNVVGNLGGYMVTLLPRTSIAAFSGAAGSTTGALVVEGDAFATLGSAITLTSAMIGRTFKLNGEPNDYVVTAINNTSKVLTVDKPILTPLTGTGVSGTGSGYLAAATRWEIGPVGRYKLRFLPSPTVSGTVYIRYMKYARRLIGNSDVPEIQEDMHGLLSKGAMEDLATGKQALEWAATFGAQFKDRIAMLQKSDMDEGMARAVPRVMTLDDDFQRQPKDLYTRYRYGRY